MLISGAVEWGMEGLKEFLFGFEILPSLGIFLNPFQSPGYLAGIL